MKKSLIIGMATLALTGTALLASSMYAATSTSIPSTTDTSRQMRHNPQEFLTTLSGEVSPAAYNAAKSLFDAEKVRMDTLRTSATKPDRATMQAAFDSMKVKVAALIVAYPELKDKIPTAGQGDRMGVHGGDMAGVLATLPTTAQDQLKTIRDSYKAKMDILRTTEKSEIDSILVAYPEVKAKLDALESSRESGMRKRGGHGHHGGGFQ